MPKYRHRDIYTCCQSMQILVAPIYRQCCCSWGGGATIGYLYVCVWLIISNPLYGLGHTIKKNEYTHMVVPPVWRYHLCRYLLFIPAICSFINNPIKRTRKIIGILCCCIDHSTIGTSISHSNKPIISKPHGKIVSCIHTEHGFG